MRLKSLFMIVMLLGLVAMLTTPSIAGYNGIDNGSYRGSKTIHFSVDIDSTTTTAIFSSSTYNSDFDTMDGMEFVVSGSSAIFICDEASFDTGVSSAPSSNVRYMALAEKYVINGRNKDEIYGRCQKGGASLGGGTAVITGTVWGH